MALRIVRACHDLGIRAIAVYSDADRDALHVRVADAAYPIGPAAARESYLNAARIIEVAKRSGCDAVHPGYGFLSENADFAQAVADAGLVFVGPPAKVQRLLGEKTAARRLAREVEVPVAKGTEPLRDAVAARQAAKEIGYPVLLKPAGGGGGKGMRVVARDEGFDAAWRGATGEATAAFGQPALYLERQIMNARHVEMQILADGHGTVVWLGERDCSIQRRHQKLIEESPGPSVTEELRAKLGAAAVRIAKRAGYVNAGTVEFLVEAYGQFNFLEVNTRLQVEHPVTEMVTGIDLVALQLRIAGGEPLPFTQDQIERRGAAIECRITAEDPFAGFVPASGRVALVREPAGPGIRVDSALFSGMTVPSEYDSLLAKVIAFGGNREEAVGRMRRALEEMRVAGIPTSLPFHRAALFEQDFVTGRYDTDFVARWDPKKGPDLPDGTVTAGALAAVLAMRSRGERRAVPVADPAWGRAGREDALR
ncbi:MAG: ATP-grasp domain-containing protein [Chloroflexi bacterium]|nr:MAG: ATP-grasp domain-containing protein [Chloroflexota bacterium]TME69176.1 MAG: ATP-grasp domain-containing protein [Chloroflexota bacterium]TMG48515.1 MAG: ATP-grasp domain-containing protein [Chloroflexota bacterium]